VKQPTPNPNFSTPARTGASHATGHHAQVKRGNTTRSLTAEERRRAQRVLLRININIQIEGKTNVIQGQTHTVSENGAMLILTDTLPENAKISIENCKTQKKVDARVVRQGQHTSEGFLVPVQFLAPSPSFWSVFFPPVVN